MDIKLNAAVLFRNTKKTSENQPDLKGQVNIEGKLYDIAFWTKTSAGGIEYWSGKVSEPFTKDETIPMMGKTATEPDPAAKPKTEAEAATDDLPF